MVDLIEKKKKQHPLILGNPRSNPDKPKILFFLKNNKKFQGTFRVFFKKFQGTFRPLSNKFGATFLSLNMFFLYPFSFFLLLSLVFIKSKYR